MTYIRQLDAFRFFACSGVLIAHLLKIDSPLLARVPFAYGVNLFFVLSGFLITRVLLHDKETKALTRREAIKNFYIRRTLRIFPIYYGTVIFLYLIRFQNYEEATPWMLSYAANIHISLGLPPLGSYNHFWSLAVEEQFYLAWPFLILMIPNAHLGKVIYSVIVTSLVYKAGLYMYYGGWHPAINSSTIGCMDALGLGALLAFWERHDTAFFLSLVKKSAWVLLPVALFFLMLKVYPTFPGLPFVDSIYPNSIFSFMSFLLLIPAAQDAYRGWFKRIIENEVIVHLGKISYGLYLYHLFMPDLYGFLTGKELLPAQGNVVRFCIYVLMCLLLAEASWWLVEKPVNGLKRYFA